MSAYLEKQPGKGYSKEKDRICKYETRKYVTRNSLAHRARASLEWLESRLHMEIEHFKMESHIINNVPS